jgi:hypothetical protein
VIPLNPDSYRNPSTGQELVPSGAGNTNAFNPANSVNPVYKPDGTIKAGTGLGG